MSEDVKKIRITSSGYGVPRGTIITAPIDGTGDARLNEDDAELYDTRWVFGGDYEVVEEEDSNSGSTAAEELKDPGDRYTVTVPIKDLLELHDLFQVLPRATVEKLTLRVN